MFLHAAHFIGERAYNKTMSHNDKSRLRLNGQHLYVEDCNHHPKLDLFEYWQPTSTRYILPRLIDTSNNSMFTISHKLQHLRWYGDEYTGT